jgi:hypothetical protein
MHHTTEKFWREYHSLSADVQEIADRAYQLLRANPQHPSLHFKRVGRFWSARVGASHRALGVDAQDGIVWFWIGSHEDYDRIIGKK